MTSQIDATLPVAGNPTTASVRGNFATAAGEISALQTNTQGAPFLPLAGATMKGPMLLFNDPTAPMSPVTLGYFQANGGGGGTGGGVPEAPADGVPYGRQDASWQHVLALAGGTMTGGIHFNPTTGASSVTDLSKHLDLGSGTHGFNVGPAGNVNYNVPTGQTHNFLINGVAAFTIAAAAITSPSPIALPADPTTALQASTKQYVDAQVATKLADAPNDGAAYLRMSQAWHYGTPNLGPSAVAAAGAAVVDYSTTQTRISTLTGSLTPYNANSDGLNIAARRLASPYGANGINVDGAFITVAGASFPQPDVITLNACSNAAGYKTWQFNTDGSATFPGNLTLQMTPATDLWLTLNRPAGHNIAIVAETSGSRRWGLLFTGDPESGGNAGTNLAINRYDDSGNALNQCVTLSRLSGQLTLTSDGAYGDPLWVQTTSDVAARTMYRINNNTRTWSCGVVPGSHNFAIADETGSAIALAIIPGTQGALQALQGRLMSVGQVGGINPSVTVYDTNLGASGMFLGSGGNFYFSTMNANGGFNAIHGWFDPSHNFTINGAGFQPGGGPWSATSDARIKRVEGSYTRGLADLVQLVPRQFVYIGNDTPVEPIAPADKAITVPYANSPHHDAATQEKLFTGLVAQEVEAIFPEWITYDDAFIDGVAVTDLRHLDTGPLLYAVVNALKEINNRLNVLEARS